MSVPYSTEETASFTEDEEEERITTKGETAAQAKLTAEGASLLEAWDLLLLEFGEPWVVQLSSVPFLELVILNGTGIFLSAYETRPINELHARPA